MTGRNDRTDMAFRASDPFAKDGKINAKALAQIVDSAERNRILEHNGIQALRNTIAHPNRSEPEAAMRAKLAELLKKINQDV